jgi:hypothetical protein
MFFVIFLIILVFQTSMIKDERIKKLMFFVIFLIILVFQTMKGKLKRSNAVLVCMRFRIHRYIAAPIKLLSRIRNFRFLENGICICTL